MLNIKFTMFQAFKKSFSEEQFENILITYLYLSFDQKLIGI